jgi:hypothetical protein
MMMVRLKRPRKSQAVPGIVLEEGVAEALELNRSSPLFHYCRTQFDERRRPNQFEREIP